MREMRQHQVQENVMDKQTMKLFGDYDFAWFKLAQARHRLFPPGTKVKCKLTGRTAIVTEGSLYADQVNTASGHMSWRYLEETNSEERT
jgi:hypothetical protein